MHRHLYCKRDPHAILEIYNKLSLYVRIIISLHQPPKPLFFHADQCSHEHVTAVLLVNCQDGRIDKLYAIGHLLFHTYPIMTTFVRISRLTFIAQGLLFSKTARGCPPVSLGQPTKCSLTDYRELTTGITYKTVLN